MFRKWIGFILALVLCALPLGVFAATVEVTRGGVNLRTGPGTQYESLGRLDEGVRLTRISQQDGWVKVDYNGAEVYVSVDYVRDVGEGGEAAGAPSSAAAGAVTATGNANVRSGPGTGYEKLGKIKKGADYPKLGEADGWVNILFGGASAYVSAAYVRDAGDAGESARDYVTMTRQTYVYAGPGSKYKKLVIMKKGAALQKLGEDGSYTKVRLYTGGTGYIPTNYVEKTAKIDNSGVACVGDGFMEKVADEAIALTNKVRAQYGKKALKTSAALMRAAEVRCNEIVKKFGHIRPDGTDCITVDPIHMSGENIGYADGGSMFQTAQSVIVTDGFMTSKEHFANMLSNEYGAIGMAGQRVGQNTYWVQVFGP